ncbi:MAG: hypothetical protein AB2A00_34000 [Myxococcota bacterium]
MRNLLLPASLASLALLALGACPNTSGTPTPPGGGLTSSSSSSGGGTSGGFDAGLVSNSCALDQDCGAGGICAGDGGCSTGVTCDPAGFVCGECDVGGSQDCGFPSQPAYCDPSARVCRRLLSSCGPCTADEQCGENPNLGLPNKCIDYGSGQKYCGIACNSPAGCSQGFVCENGGCKVAPEVGSCIGAVPCTHSSQCPDGTYCTTYIDEETNPRQGVCLAFCLYDEDCPAGKICSLDPSPTYGQCINGCAPGATVGTDRICHEWGRYGAMCPAQACPAGYECSNATEGYCKQAGCDDDTECPLARTICDVPTRTCVPGCHTEEQCGAFEICDNGECRDQGCRGKELSCNVGQFCCGQELYAAGGEACPSGIATGDCFNLQDPFCRTCEDDDGCSDINRFNQASHCYEMQRSNADGGTETIGKFCSVGCRTADDCPRGFRCQDLPAGQNGETVKGCLEAICAGFAQ